MTAEEIVPNRQKAMTRINYEHFFNLFSFNPADKNEVLKKSSIFYAHGLSAFFNNTEYEYKKLNDTESDIYQEIINRKKSGEDSSDPIFYIGNSRFFYTAGRPDINSPLRTPEYLIYQKPEFHKDFVKKNLFGQGWTEVEIANSLNTDSGYTEIEREAEKLWHGMLKTRINTLIERDQKELGITTNFLYALARYLPMHHKGGRMLPEKHGAKMRSSFAKINLTESKLLMEGFLTLTLDNKKNTIVCLPGLPLAHQLAKHMSDYFPIKDTEGLKKFHDNYHPVECIEDDII